MGRLFREMRIRRNGGHHAILTDTNHTISIARRHQGKHYDGDHSQGNSDQKERRIRAKHSGHGLLPRSGFEVLRSPYAFDYRVVYWEEACIPVEVKGRGEREQRKEEVLP